MGAIEEQRRALCAVVWHGSRREGLALRAAITNHCTCRPHEPLCAAHQLVLSQHTLDALLVLRHCARILCGAIVLSVLLRL